MPGTQRALSKHQPSLVIGVYTQEAPVGVNHDLCPRRMENMHFSYFLVWAGLEGNINITTSRCFFFVCKRGLVDEIRCVFSSFSFVLRLDHTIPSKFS